MNKGALFLLVSCIAFLAGLMVREVIDGPPPIESHAQASGDSGQVEATQVQASTQVIEVRAVLEMPTATATSTARPTATGTAKSDFCTTPTTGQLCRVPYPPPPTPTPYPFCEDVMATPVSAGNWCVWEEGP